MNILFKFVWRADSVAITMSGASLLSQDLFLIETDGRRRAEEGICPARRRERWNRIGLAGRVVRKQS
jgi:hypothetical protein